MSKLTCILDVELNGYTLSIHEVAPQYKVGLQGAQTMHTCAAYIWPALCKLGPVNKLTGPLLFTWAT